MPDPPKSEPQSAFVCDCGEWALSACVGERFYKEHEGKRYCVLHSPSKEKGADFEAVVRRKLERRDFNFRRVWFPDALPFRDTCFSAAVDFGSATFSAGVNFSHATFSAEANFESATFSAGVNFSHATFSAEANFESATFSAKANFTEAVFIDGAGFAVTFKKRAVFSQATFHRKGNFNDAEFQDAADFYACKFLGNADFIDAVFKGKTDFRYSEFCAEANFQTTFGSEVDFLYAFFRGEAYFRYAVFNAPVNFRSATFKDYLRFGELKFGETTAFDFQYARIEKPERVAFHSPPQLRPYWFVNVDARKFDLININWHYKTLRIESETRKLGEKGVATPHRLLAIALQNLAFNAEENHRYGEASKLRYMAMEARRLESWRGFVPWRLSWWYWLASGYGERMLRALLVLLGIWLVAGLLYTQVGFARWEPRLASEADFATARKDEFGAPLPFSRALTYSAGVMTLQRPEPKPATTAARTLVLFETILGPIQAALLALAIRRKFMR